MSVRHKGGCLCGKVRYEFEGDPLMAAICHCRHCQRQSGAPFSVVLAVADTAMTGLAAVKTYHDRGDSGQGVERLFCPDCGSPIVSRVDAMPGLSFVKAGTLDAPECWTPTVEVYCARAWPWLPALAAERHALSNLGDGQ